MVRKGQVEEIFSEHGLGKVRTLEKVKGGCSNPVYFVNGIYVLRVLEDPDFSKYVKERYLFSLIRKKTNVPVPKVIALSRSRRILGHPYMLLERLKGENLINVQMLKEHKFDIAIIPVEVVIAHLSLLLF